MVDSSDQRDFRRMMLNCEATLQSVADGTVLRGNAINISATGMLVLCDQVLPEGGEYQINITPERRVTPPLDALVEVLRVKPAQESGLYEVAFVIKEMQST